MMNSSDNRAIAKAYEKMLLEGVVPSDVPGEKTLVNDEEGGSNLYEIERRRVIEIISWEATQAVFDVIADRFNHVPYTDNPVIKASIDGNKFVRVPRDFADRILSIYGKSPFEGKYKLLAKEYEDMFSSIKELFFDRLLDVVHMKLVRWDNGHTGGKRMPWAQIEPFHVFLELSERRPGASVELVVKGYREYLGTFSPSHNKNIGLEMSRSRGLQYHTPNLPK